MTFNFLATSLSPATPDTGVLFARISPISRLAEATLRAALLWQRKAPALSDERRVDDRPGGMPCRTPPETAMSPAGPEVRGDEP